MYFFLNKIRKERKKKKENIDLLYFLYLFFKVQSVSRDIFIPFTDIQKIPLYIFIPQTKKLFLFPFSSLFIYLFSHAKKSCLLCYNTNTVFLLVKT